MNINLEKITDLQTFLLEKKNDYYEEYKNLINEIEYSFSYWDDSKAQWLNKSLNEIKIKYESLFEELDSVSDIYRTLENKYSVLGNKISFNKENSEDLINLMSEKIFEEGIVWDNKEEVIDYFRKKVEAKENE